MGMSLILTKYDIRLNFVEMWVLCAWACYANLRLELNQEEVVMNLI